MHFEFQLNKKKPAEMYANSLEDIILEENILNELYFRTGLTRRNIDDDLTPSRSVVCTGIDQFRAVRLNRPFPSKHLTVIL